MKRSLLFALGCAMVAGTASAQNASEVTYVEDPAQGYIFNKFSDNWFIQAEGGVSVGFSTHDSELDFTDRIAPAASLYVGKWFSPLLGLRGGVDFLSVKGLVDKDAYGNAGVRPYEGVVDGKYYNNKQNYVGPTFDVMLNLTNWWCGYRPGRVYNAYVYFGGGYYWTLAKFAEKNEEPAWHNAKDGEITIRAGLTQEFNLSKHFALGLDLRATAIPNHSDLGGRTTVVGQALLTATYKFNNSTWAAPVVPVCPPAEDCSEYQARLAEADARLADLQNQYDACMKRPVEKVVEKVPEAPLATIYYPADVYTLTSVDRKVLQSVANAMKANDKEYNITGWADNYTGTPAINVPLRKNRAEGVKKMLVRYGVPANRLTIVENNGNRVDLGDKCLTLDRCVTIMEK